MKEFSHQAAPSDSGDYILPLEETVKPRRRQRINIPQEEMDDPSWEAAPVKKAINTEVENSVKQNCTGERVSIGNTN